MQDSASILRDALVASYRPYVVDRAAAHGFEVPDDFDAVLREGEKWLGRELDEVLSLPFDRQPRGPLEVFQEAMRFPTEALIEAGREPQPRDPAVAAALPGDLFDLAPASSQSVGEEVWEAHIAWGVMKARDVSRPTVGLLSADLFDISRTEAEIERSGFRLEVWGGPPDVEGRARPPLVALVDLTHPESDECIRRCASAGLKVIGFGPHVDDLAMVRAQALGATDALARSRFFRSIPDLLPTLT